MESTEYKMTTKNKIWPWLIVVAYGILNACTMQLIFSNFGVFVPFILADMGFGAGDFSFTMTVSILAMAVSIPIMGRLINKVDIRLLLAAGLIVAVGAWCCNGFWTEVWQWWVTGIFIGLGGGIVFAQTMPIVTGNWFAKNKGTAIGGTYMISAILSFSLAMVVAWFINMLGWRMAYHVMALISVVICLPFILFVIRLRPSDMGMKPYGWTPEMELEEGQSEIDLESTQPGMLAKDALKTVAFWLLFILGGVVTLIGSGFSTQMSNAAVTWGYDATFGASLVGTIALYRFVSPLAGWVGDKIGATRGMLLWLFLCALGFLGFIFIHDVAPLLYVFMILYACYTSQQNTFMPMLVREFFGSKDYSRCYTNIAVGFSAIGAFGSTIVGFMYDMGGQSYTTSFWFGIGLCVISAVLLFIAKASAKNLKWED